jgi:hypothetical protein
MLEYTLEMNELTDAPSDMRAQVINVTSYTQNDIVERIMRIGAGLTRSDIVSVLEAEKQVIGDIIAEGGAVNTELFNAFPSIHGVFTGVEDSLDASRHKVKINLHAGTALRLAVAQVKTKKVAAVITGTVITSVTDIKSGTVNDQLTPGRDLKIHGVKLKISGADPACGLYFAGIDTGKETLVDPADIVVNNPSELIALVPDLAAGTYQAKIVTQYNGGKGRKTPISVTFDKVLTVG